jgi:hypothetical protein
MPAVKTRVFACTWGAVYRMPGGGYLCQFRGADEATSFFTTSLVTARQEVRDYHNAMERETRKEKRLANWADTARKALSTTKRATN